VPRGYRLYVELDLVRPEIWRTLVVPAHLTLHDLHLVLQASMGWANSHGYEFQIEDRSYGEPDSDGSPDSDSRKTALRDLRLDRGSEFLYRYDFGDDWEHSLKVEEVIRDDDADPGPRCADGKRACPPEDCGGPEGYKDILKAIRDPRHPEHSDVREWLGADFDPEGFDRAAVNQALKSLE
jgi:hypothetical protein